MNFEEMFAKKYSGQLRSLHGESVIKTFFKEVWQASRQATIDDCVGVVENMETDFEEEFEDHYSGTKSAIKYLEVSKIAKALKELNENEEIDNG